MYTELYILSQSKDFVERNLNYPGHSTGIYSQMNERQGKRQYMAYK